jgi:hypothetical protein
MLQPLLFRGKDRLPDFRRGDLLHCVLTQLVRLFVDVAAIGREAGVGLL